MTRGADQSIAAARFDLSGLPRIESMLLGRPVGEVPPLVERLCGVCPAAHHLAGVAALEALRPDDSWAGVPATARLLRRLLHHGSVLATHAFRLLAQQGRDEAVVLHKLAKAAMAAAGSPGHFPTTAVPGGARQPADPDAVAAARGMVDNALSEARSLALGALATDTAPTPFQGCDVALVDDDGNADLLGGLLRAVGPDGQVVAEGRPAQWARLVAESRPGDPAARPYLLALGPEGGKYRVGPVSQLRVGPLSTPESRQLQLRWLEGGSAPAARAVVTLHCVESIAVLLADPLLLDAEVSQTLPAVSAATGVGWVDGARGLLVHSYTTDSAGVLVGAQILTPTAQNEYWLARLLLQAADADSAALEDAVREADPCLPCATAPKGRMGLVVEWEEGS
jgi:NAD-reducing hydrogenase large subunit